MKDLPIICVSESGVRWLVQNGHAVVDESLMVMINAFS